jgi:hypothetical protein
MRKGQVNIVIAIGMLIATIWALLNLWGYTQDIGLASTIREKVISSIERSELERLMFDQERKYMMEQALLLTGIGGAMSSSACGELPPNISFPFLPTEKIRYWKNFPSICVPSEDEVIQLVDSILTNSSGFVKFAKIGIAPGAVESDFTLKLDRVDDIYEGYLRRAYLGEVEYRVEYDPSTWEVRFFIGDSLVTVTNVTWGEVVLGEIIDIPIVLEGIRREEIWLDERWVIAGIKEKSKCVELGGVKYVFTAPAVGIDGTIHRFDLYQCVDCYEGCALMGFDLNLYDTITLDYEYEIIALDNLTGKFIVLENLDHKILKLRLKDLVYFIPERETFEFPEVRIGEVYPERGMVSYNFVPAENDKVCLIEETPRLSLKTCSSLLTEVTSRGGFTDLYSFAKDYVAGEHGPYQGWQEYELDHQIDVKLDAIDLKTLKVFIGEQVIPKQDWKTRLIWALGLVGTPYTWEEVDDCCQIIAGVEVCACEYCPPTLPCEEVLETALIAEFLRIFEQISPSKLEVMTGYPWVIRIRDLKVNVTNLCEDESFFVQHTPHYTFEETNESMVLGLPIQILFGENSRVLLESRYSDILCKCQELGPYSNVGDPCLLEEEGICDCYLNDQTIEHCLKEYNEITGEEEEVCITYAARSIPFSCSQYNYCCPPGYDERLWDGTTVLPCCRVWETSRCGEDGTREVIYKCYELGGTSPSDYTTNETCGIAKGTYGVITWR